MVRLLRHRRTKGPETDRPHLNHCATSRLYPIEDFFAAGRSRRNGDCGCPAVRPTIVLTPFRPRELIRQCGMRLLVTEWAIFQFWLLDQTARFAGCLESRWNVAYMNLKSSSWGKVLSVLSDPFRCDITRRGGKLMGIWAARLAAQVVSTYTHVCIPDWHGQFKLGNWATLVFFVARGRRGREGTTRQGERHTECLLLRRGGHEEHEERE
jgi:hypothetical protein